MTDTTDGVVHNEIQGFSMSFQLNLRPVPFSRTLNRVAFSQQSMSICIVHQLRTTTP